MVYIDKFFRIRIDYEDLDLLPNFVRENNLDICCTGGIDRNRDGWFYIDAYGSDKETKTLSENFFKWKTDRLTIEQIDITEYLLDRQKEVGTGDRYKDKKELLRGYGTKVKKWWAILMSKKLNKHW